ncbi:hypothetical protein GCM10010271_30570 [Streptomyces kurssanovii]|nr:hypothetical protein GCM10010271_30570 [Streptomyces kurssanovii]
MPHSHDTGDPRVTWRASDVLRQRTGICYAKAHGLAALLRAEDIPAALCYQRLEGVVHGLVAVRFHGAWHRQDPRGGRFGGSVPFSLAGERLPFTPRPESSDMDYSVLYAVPHPVVLEALRKAPDRARLWKTLPTSL